MQTILQHEQQDGRAEPGSEGRFGRAPLAEDRQAADAGTTTDPPGEPRRIDLVRYEVDADAVARAILDRLVAGRTLLLRPADDR
jgi:hypothetical protein